jgi:hypothetical protein
VDKQIPLIDSSHCYSSTTNADTTCVDVYIVNTLTRDIRIVNLCELMMMVCSGMVELSLGRSLQFLSCRWLPQGFLWRHMRT